MPKYTYKCPKCDIAVSKILSIKKSNEPITCECGEIMKKQLPRVMEPSVMDTVDKYRNVKHRKDQDKRLRKRAKDYFVENEMPDLIAKHGIKEAKKMGWVKKDGKKVKKDDMK